mmetsp:Transcript_125329/g.304337  ORF Transcript_125329/g.304337 Transcript_125329/m.304337 type:complete len:295 (+) Transcript_125329:451-1335(+)
MHGRLKVRGGLHDAARPQHEALAVMEQAKQHVGLHSVEARVLLEAPPAEAHGRVEADEAWPLDAADERRPLLREQHLHGHVRIVERPAVGFDLKSGIVHVSAVDHRAVRHRCQDSRAAEGLAGELGCLHAEQTSSGGGDGAGRLVPARELVADVQEKQALHGHVRVPHVRHDALQLPPVHLGQGHRLQHPRDLAADVVVAALGEDAQGPVVPRHVPPTLLRGRVEIHHELRRHCPEFSQRPQGQGVLEEAHRVLGRLRRVLGLAAARRAEAQGQEEGREGRWRHGRCGEGRGVR